MAGIPKDPPADVTTLLQNWSRGDEHAFDQLMPIVYRELRQIAARYLRHERAGHTLQATVLVNEAYLHLVKAKEVNWNDRLHFLAVAARIMRRILVDHARARQSQKRGGGAERIVLDEATIGSDNSPQSVIALHDALEALAIFDQRKSRVIELRFFGGLSVDETAAVLQVAPETVNRDWRLAKAWLRREMRADTSREV